MYPYFCITLCTFSLLFFTDSGVIGQHARNCCRRYTSLFCDCINIRTLFCHKCTMPFCHPLCNFYSSCPLQAVSNLFSLTIHDIFFFGNGKFSYFQGNLYSNSSRGVIFSLSDQIIAKTTGDHSPMVFYTNLWLLCVLVAIVLVYAKNLSCQFDFFLGWSRYTFKTILDSKLFPFEYSECMVWKLHRYDIHYLRC